MVLELGRRCEGARVRPPLRRTRQGLAAARARNAQRALRRELERTCERSLDRRCSSALAARSGSHVLAHDGGQTRRSRWVARISASIAPIPMVAVESLSLGPRHSSPRASCRRTAIQLSRREVRRRVSLQRRVDDATCPRARSADQVEDLELGDRRRREVERERGDLSSSPASTRAAWAASSPALSRRHRPWGPRARRPLSSSPAPTGARAARSAPALRTWLDPCATDVSLQKRTPARTTNAA